MRKNKIYFGNWAFLWTFADLKQEPEMEGIEKLRAVLEAPKKIVITTHHKPDGDALGSCLALSFFLTSFDHGCSIISPTDYAPFLGFLPGSKAIINFETEPVKCAKLIGAAELIFCLDFNKLHRVNDMEAMILKSNAKIVLIDHHIGPDPFAHYSMTTDTASSTAELIYDFISLLGGEQRITPAIATCLYTGIMTDTGSFRFPSTSPRVHHIVADLMDKGADNAEIHEAVFDDFSEERLRFFGYCLGEKMKIYPEYKLGLITVTAEEIQRFRVKTGDTEGLVNYPLAIRGIAVAALIIDRTKVVKLSLRSKGDFPVNQIASDHFDGGGHKNAAGGSSKDTLEKTVERFLEVMKTMNN